MLTKMSSDSERSGTSEIWSSPEEDISVEEDEDVEVIYSHITPYQDEPLAKVEEDVGNHLEENEEADMDGLTASVLEVRYEKEVLANSWYV